MTNTIWKHEVTLEGLQNMSMNTMVSHLDIEFIEIGSDYIIAKMPVTEKTVQPMRILHGGASVVLAETLGSVASTLLIEDLTVQQPVGLEINANHIRSVAEGLYVIGKVNPVHIGRTTHVWNIEIRNAEDKIVCISRLTMAVR
jgi:1,4-dihydroxy-2-naphthoyl-CoA hydrolase